MPADHILNIAITVAFAQAGCDLLARRFVYGQPPYQRAVSAFERAKSKRDKIVAAAAESEAAANASPTPAKSSTSARKRGKGGPSTPVSTAEAVGEKNKKKVQRAEEEFAEAASEVARKHLVPNFLSSFVFILLFRILSTEHHTRVIALLPFEPWSLLRRLTMRGLVVHEEATNPELQADTPALPAHTTACSFLFIYILCTLSVKFVVAKVTGQQPPAGADKGIMTMIDAPKNAKMLQSLGVDTEGLKESRGKLM